MKCLTEHRLSCSRIIMPRLEALPNVINIVAGSHGLVLAPTRLIRVGSDAPGDPPKLVDGQECLRKGGYLALSYCWGNIPKDAPWLLTSKTMAAFSAELDMTILPQTLHDAILWTRRLDQRYIWIDCLCIIQDDTEDWQREAMKMDMVYANGVMTLAAASSSVYGGLTDRLNPLKNTAAALQLRDGTTVYVLPHGQIPGDLAHAPVDVRAWCLQEDMLSARLIKIKLRSIEWECLNDGTKSRAKQSARPLDYPVYRWHNLWYRFIERYCSRWLSKSTDKLVAFHGVAIDKMGRDYVAGFLKTDPWMSLLWCRDENHITWRPGKRYKDYVAPSFSWASLESPVLFYEAGARDLRKAEEEATLYDPEFLTVKVIQATHFNTGAVKSGSLEISAYTSLAYTSAMPPFLFNTRQGSHSSGRRNLRDPRTGTVLGMIVFDVAGEAKDNDWLCCALLYTSNVGLWEKNATAGLGIALKITKSTPDALECRRVGYVQFTSHFTKFCYRRQLHIT